METSVVASRSRPRRRAAKAALDAIHRHYGVTSSPSPVPSFFVSAKDRFVGQVFDYMKKAEAISLNSPNGRKQRYAIYTELFHHTSNHVKFLNTMPQARRTILRKVEEFEEQLATHREQFPTEEIKQTLRQLATRTRNVSQLFPYMEVTYQQKLNALIQHVEEYEKDVVAMELRDAMTRIKELLQST